MGEAQKVHGTGHFVPGSVRIIDYDSTHNNLLVRGSAAFGADNFSMDTLIETIQSAPNYADTGITPSSTAMVVDFCLIGYGPGNHKDQGIVAAELGWFNAPTPPTLNGCSGPYPTIAASASGDHVMVYWPVLSLGGTVPTSEGENWDSAHAVDASIEAASNGYDFAGLVPAIRHALSNQPSKIPGFTGDSITDAIIYVHCDSGINRTGAAIISYLMQYGSNIKALGIAASPASPFHTLRSAQAAALIDPPEGDKPPGGVDQGVSEAYCNLINTGKATNDLSARCVPKKGSVNT